MPLLVSKALYAIVCKSPLPHKTQKNNSLFTDTLASPYLMCII